ncbi:leucine--tRNA ligase [Oxobacter pfennigii]|uniref:Leucine--tRNA ligase n=1 Tax=Oxobacter pfennigii TaxID=36849 RepID=A0A0P9ALL7_9CLOT|nr:leucine--tRNA ligase [Oxobacter pfennigii]KPU46277.1 leucine--tRNA ligase [Oxobacter pfennigii]
MSTYSTDIDKKWQKKWEDTELYKFNMDRLDKKLYCLEMFSYPSGAKLHVGHWYNYGPTDSWARMKRMQGYEIFQPMGFDAFGLPAENYAIKTGIHPQDSTLNNIETMERQLKEMGAMFDWDHEVKTCMPDYYKWTQWVFLTLYKAGLAYRKEAPVNWCPSCNTVLANEQVQDGSCERCGTEVTRKNLTQWFLRITNYADELLEKLDTIDWPEKTKAMQRNWIGRSTGAELTFSIADSNLTFNVFTTRPDTLFGVTYVVLAPENELVDKITTAEYKKAVEEYQDAARKQSEIERLSTTKEKTGVFTGAYAINPINGEKVPVWTADYILNTYGTGCVMAVPGHDERDFEFAEKFNLPIIRVVKGAEGNDDLPFVEYGVSVNSGEFSGLATEDAKKGIVEKLADHNKGALKVNYRLRDWLVSRQRYWGAPIPMIHCDKCGVVPVPEEDLPVLLPYNVEFAPDGKSPLAKSEEFMNTTCPHCGGPAKRDPDTLDTFVCSSFYFLRYPDNKNSDKIFDKDLVNKMLPVDKYVGGAEHACMHLLYARFVTKALRDLGYLDFDEPFLSLVHQGTILGPDGNKMSKSRGNVVSPDDYISKFGSDVFRLYLMFGFAYIEGGAWSDEGIKAIDRFLDRIERLTARVGEIKTSGTVGKNEKDLKYAINYAVKGVTEDADKFQFNTAIARMMELLNAMYKYDSDTEDKNAEIFKEGLTTLLKCLAPFAPHFTEEMWEKLGMNYSVFNESWPAFDPSALIKDVVELGIQINGKIRSKVEVPSDMPEEQIKETVLADEKITVMFEGKSVKKIIVVKGRLVNIVIG